MTIRQSDRRVTADHDDGVAIDPSVHGRATGLEAPDWQRRDGGPTVAIVLAYGHVELRDEKRRTCSRDTREVKLEQLIGGEDTMLMKVRTDDLISFSSR
jgi:hypothetical protein